MFTTAAESDLLHELEELRQQVRALQPPGRLRLQTQQAQPFLGQPVLLTVSATDLNGQPLIDTPLTLITTWGNLRTTHELIPQQANSLTTRTNAEGQATLVLLPPTSEDLSAVQQEALETFLALLDPQAETPQQAQASLEELVKLYDWEANVAYRQAVDIYFRDFGQGLLESVNAYDYLQAWSYQNATAIAFLQPDANSGGSTQVTATLTLQFKNWLAPWLETYLAVSQRNSPLEQSLGIIKERGDAGSVVEGVYDRLQSFIETQPGIVGQYIGRKVAETSVNEFLNRGIDDLELDAKVALAPSLSVASKTLQTSGVSGLAGIVQARTELTQVVTSTVGQSTAAIAGLTEQVGAIATQVNGVQTRIGDLQSNVGSMDGRIGAIATQVTTLNTSVADTTGRLGTLTTRFDGLNTSVTNVDARLGTLTTRFDGIQTSVTEVNGRLGTLSTRVDGLQTRSTQSDRQLELVLGQVGVLQENNRSIATSVTQLSDRLATVQQTSTTLNTQVGTLVTQVDGLQRDQTTVVGRIDGLQRDQITVVGRIDGLQRDQTTLVGRVDAVQRNQTTLNTNLGTVTTRIDGIQQSFSTLDGRVGTLTTQVGGLQTNVGRLDTQVGGLQTNVSRLDTQVGSFQPRFTTLDTQVGGLQNRVGTLDTQVGGLQGNFDRFSRASTSRILQLEDSVTRVGNTTLSVRTDLNNRLGG